MLYCGSASGRGQRRGITRPTRSKSGGGKAPKPTFWSSEDKCFSWGGPLKTYRRERAIRGAIRWRNSPRTKRGGGSGGGGGLGATGRGGEWESTPGSSKLVKNSGRRGGKGKSPLRTKAILVTARGKETDESTFPVKEGKSRIGDKGIIPQTMGASNEARQRT